MAGPSFSPILDRKPGDIEKPRNLVIGSYIFITKGLPRFDKAKTGTEFSEFMCIPQGPVPAPDGEGNLDVDQEALDEVLTRKNGEKAAIQSKPQRLTFYHTEDAIWRLEAFLRDLGFDIPTDDEKKEMTEEQLDALPSLRQMINESPNRRFGGYISHKPSDDGTQMYANITKTFRLDE